MSSSDLCRHNQRVPGVQEASWQRYRRLPSTWHPSFSVDGTLGTPRDHSGPLGIGTARDHSGPLGTTWDHLGGVDRAKVELVVCSCEPPVGAMVANLFPVANVAASGGWDLLGSAGNVFRTLEPLKLLFL